MRTKRVRKLYLGGSKRPISLPDKCQLRPLRRVKSALTVRYRRSFRKRVVQLVRDERYQLRRCAKLKKAAKTSNRLLRPCKTKAGHQRPNSSRPKKTKMPASNIFNIKNSRNGGKCARSIRISTRLPSSQSLAPHHRE